MNQDHNTLILAAGSNVFLLPDGSHVSKPEFRINGQKMIDKIISMYMSGNTYLAISDENITLSGDKQRIKNVPVGNTEGALISALIAIRHCDLDLPLFITPGDAIIPENIYEKFRKKSLISNQEISLIVFDSHNPKYSYMRMLDGKLVEVSEKKVISSQATTGIYYFKSAHLFIECAEWAIMNNIRTNNLFFLAPALNYAVVKGLNPDLFQIREDEYYRFKDYFEAVESEKRYCNASK
jgi:hypothetical protein